MIHHKCENLQSPFHFPVSHEEESFSNFFRKSRVKKLIMKNYIYGIESKYRCGTGVVHFYTGQIKNEKIPK